VRSAASFGEDEEGTKKALEGGILADVKGVFPKAHFEGAPKKIFNLDKDLTVPPAGSSPLAGNAPQPFCGLSISFDYPEVSAGPGGAGGLAGSPAGEGPK
jgi:hypothetical protein